MGLVTKRHVVCRKLHELWLNVYLDVWVCRILQELEISGKFDSPTNVYGSPNQERDRWRQTASKLYLFFSKSSCQVTK